MKRIITYIIISLGAVSLGTQNQHGAYNAARCIPMITRNISDTALHLINGVYLLNGAPFTGYINTYYDNGTLESRSPYVEGKLYGTEERWFANGVKQSERPFVNGEKTGTHIGWYDTGKMRFEYRFIMGRSEGLSTDWYPDGSVWKKVVYENGQEKSVQAWRMNGKLYANYEVKDGVIYGLNNSNLCYSMKNERGNYETAK